MNQDHLQSCVLLANPPCMALSPPRGIHHLAIGTFIPFHIFMLLLHVNVLLNQVHLPDMQQAKTLKC